MLRKIIVNIAELIAYGLMVLGTILLGLYLVDAYMVFIVLTPQDAYLDGAPPTSGDVVIRIFESLAFLIIGFFLRDRARRLLVKRP